jgi:hypothetical protein
MMRFLAAFGVLLVLAVTAAHAESPKASLAEECENGIKLAYKELDFAKAKGFGGTVEYSKAATLLSGAKIQSEFHKWPNCIDKVRRARRFLAKSRK